MRILRDPTWQFIGASVGVVAVLITLALSYMNRPIKSLRVEILSNSPLISINTDVAKDIQVLYKGQPVQTLSLILLKLENTGNIPITETDYSEPIRISLSPNAEVGEVITQETKPESISLLPKILANNQVELPKILLNPGDQAIIRILVVNNDGSLKVEARIAGVRELEVSAALEGRNTSEQLSPIVPPLICLTPLTLFILFIIIWDSKKVMGWRQRRFGFDPARHWYREAQSKMMRGAPTFDRMQATIGYLRQAFSWDSSYVQKAQEDPIFGALRKHLAYKELIDEYSAPSESEERAKIVPTNQS